jgi:hypothetical protein
MVCLPLGVGPVRHGRHWRGNRLKQGLLPAGDGCAAPELQGAAVSPDIGRIAPRGNGWRWLKVTASPPGPHWARRTRLRLKLTLT